MAMRMLKLLRLAIKMQTEKCGDHGVQQPASLSTEKQKHKREKLSASRKSSNKIDPLLMSPSQSSERTSHKSR